MSLHQRDTLADLTESDIRALTKDDVYGMSGHLASTITTEQIRWFDPVVLGQFILGERHSGGYNFSGGNYLRPEIINAITLEQIEGITHSKELPSVKELERYLMIKKLVARQGR